MKKTKKRLSINCETLRALDLHEVSGGTFFTVITKPNGSCFIACEPTRGCPPTRTCPLASGVC